jgi:xylan 1,4-beta-xylosidase
VVAGEWPDPTVLRAGNEYWATATVGSWGPLFRLLRSDDLVNWKLAGAALRRPPGWTDGSFWGPELVQLGNRFLMFFSAVPKGALPKKKGALTRNGKWYCLAVATAPTPGGPYRYRRRLRCGKYGSIDPFPVRDESGVLYLLWKEDGNEFKKPTTIFAQRLSEDGGRLFGRKHRLLRNRRGSWERGVVEAPQVVRHGEFFYMFYSGSLCCTPRCRYATGVARARRLLGPWERHPGNPILRSGSGWRCPGHPAIVDDGSGNLRAIYHAYRSGAFLVGRQLLLDPVTWGSDGWPAIGSGRPPAPVAGAPLAAFEDDFSARQLATEWEWHVQKPARIRVGGPRGLRLRAPRKGGRKYDAGLLSRRFSTAQFDATTVVDRSSLGRGTFAGVAAYRNKFEMIGVALGRRRVIVWKRRFGKQKTISARRAPSAALVHLRMRVRGKRFGFDFSTDGAKWKPMTGLVKGPIDETARYTLTVGGVRRASARFARAALVER